MFLMTFKTFIQQVKVSKDERGEFRAAHVYILSFYDVAVAYKRAVRPL